MLTAPNAGVQRNQNKQHVYHLYFILPCPEILLDEDDNKFAEDGIKTVPETCSKI